MPTWYEENLKLYMPDSNFTIPWPQTGSRFPYPGDKVPQMGDLTKLGGHTARWFVSGKEYLDFIGQVMLVLRDNPKNAFFWVHGWYFELFEHQSVLKFWGKQELPEAIKALEGSDSWELFHWGDEDLEVGQAQDPLVGLLSEMANKNVDVKIMGWMNPIMVKSRAIAYAADGVAEGVEGIPNNMDIASSMTERNVATLYSLLRVRNDHLPDEDVIFNTLPHPLGGAHTKFIVAGNDEFMMAFTGGVDLAPSRNEYSWSDVTAAVEGPAALEMAKFYRDLWNEIGKQDVVNIKFSAKDQSSGNVEVPEAEYPSHYKNNDITTLPTVKTKRFFPGNSEICMQVFRTLPRKNYSTGTPGKRYAAGLKLGNKLGATTSGFSLGTALSQLPYVWTPPISFAPDGLFEFKTVCYKAVMGAIRYIFIMDQDASNTELMRWINRRVRQLRDNGIHLKVIVWTAMLEAEGKHSPKQIDLFKVLAAGIPEQDYPKHFLWAHGGTHAKVILIDDKWVSIGSANFMRRSFYTDIEMGVAIMHETWVKEFRKAIWFWVSNAKVNPFPDDIGEALGMWRYAWELEVGRSYTVPRLNAGYILETGIPTARGIVTKVKVKTMEPARAVMKALEDPDSNQVI